MNKFNSKCLNIKNISLNHTFYNTTKNHRLASAILDGGFYEFKRQLEYKSKWYGSTLKLANRFYPSSKLCSNCGNKKGTLKLSSVSIIAKIAKFLSTAI